MTRTGSRGTIKEPVDQAQQVRGLGEVHVIDVEANGLGGQRAIVHHADPVGFEHPSQHFLLGASEVKTLFARFGRQFDGGSEGGGNVVGRQSGKVSQIIDMLGHFLVFGVQRQRRREVGPGYLGMAGDLRLIRILDQFSDAVLAGDLQSARNRGIGGIHFAALAKAFSASSTSPFSMARTPWA